MKNYNIVVSVNNNDVIGYNNQLLIESKEDLKRFYQVTSLSKNEFPNVVIMGYKTWLSIPESKKPLKYRLNIVLTKNHQSSIKCSENLIVFSDLQKTFQWLSENKTGEIFVIGGASIYEQCLREYNDSLERVYLTRFDNDYPVSDFTQLFPMDALQNMKCIQTFPKMTDHCYHMGVQKEIDFRFEVYSRPEISNRGEQQYLDLLSKVLDEGVLTESRNSKVLTTFGERMEFDLNDGFPLLTTKKMGYKTILRELLWFIKGSTSNAELQEKNVHIWDQNSSREFLDGRGLSYEEGDLGPVYGFQWRHFGAKYDTCHSDYTNLGIDQLKNVIEQLKNDPTSRRIILSAWNPCDLDKMALPPCHIMCQFNVCIPKKTLNCQLYQRSGDMFLGVPFNIASYSFLTHILAKITGLTPGKFIHVLGDTHIYEDHVKAVKSQIIRVPDRFPNLTISDELTDIDSIKEEYFKITEYNSYPKITAPMIA